MAKISSPLVFLFALLAVHCFHIRVEGGDDGCVVIGCGQGVKDTCWCCYTANVQPPLHPEDICFPTREQCEAYPCPPFPPAARATLASSAPAS